MTVTPALDFDVPRLAFAVEQLSADAVDGLPFGAIRVDDSGIVVSYNATERNLSGSGMLPRLGLDFFTGVAPCMDNPAFRGRIEAARRAGRLDIAFTHIGDFSDRTREIHIRVQSAKAGGYWIFLQRNSGE